MSQCELNPYGMWIPERPREWTKADNEAFETALAMIPTNDPNRWEKMAMVVSSGWSPEDIKQRIEMFKNDLFLIESGQLDVEVDAAEEVPQLPPMQPPPMQPPPVLSNKGMPWTQEEHGLFLLGLKHFGKGDWKSVSRYYVVSRTPSQIASHAQKYFLRQDDLKNVSNNKRKRSSIHDKTIEESFPNLLPRIPNNHNWVPPPDIIMQQSQELRQAQQILRSNPPNNLPHGFGYFNNNCF